MKYILNQYIVFLSLCNFFVTQSFILRHRHYITVLLFSTPQNYFFYIPTDYKAPSVMGFCHIHGKTPRGILLVNSNDYIIRENCVTILCTSPKTDWMLSSAFIQFSFVTPSTQHGHTRNSTSGYAL